MFKNAEPIPSIPFSPENLTRVSTKEELLVTIEVLKNAKEIAVDLEHHSYRTYAGFLCLMQLSTREHDFIVDLLVPEVRAEMAALGEVFADPGIVKVRQSSYQVM
jgi:exosome complex exonuclease RRP6